MKYFNKENVSFGILIIYIIGTLPFIEGNDNWLILTTLLSGGIYFSKYNEINKLFKIVLLYVCCVSIIMYLLSFERTIFIVTIGTILRFLTAYFCVGFLRGKLINKYINFVYYMAILSIPLYFVQLLYPSIYTSLFSGVSQIFSTDQRISSGKLSFLIFNYHKYAPYRNSGFMWEPGAFGMVVGIAQLFILVKNKFRFDKVFFVLTVAGLTTMSTTYYIVFFLLLFLMIINSNYNQSIKYLFIIGMGVGFSYLVSSLYFLLPKMEGYIAHYNYYAGDGLSQISEFGSSSGRIIQFVADVKSFYSYPFGQASAQLFRTKNMFGQTIGGASGLGRFLVSWGIIGVIFMINRLIKLEKCLESEAKNRWLNRLIFVIIFLIFLFSNPIERTPLFLGFLLLPSFILSKNNNFNRYHV